MHVRTGLFATVAAGALFAAGAVQAQLAAEDVWAQWVEAAELGGQTVAVGSQSKAGGVLSLSGVVFALDVPEGEVTATVTIDQISLAEQGDGSVAISMSDSYPMSMRFDGMAPDDALVITISHPGLTMTASGAPGAINYVYAAPEFGMEVTELRADGEDIDAILRARVGNLSGEYTVTDGAVRELASLTRMGSFDFVVDFEEPNGYGYIKAAAGLAGVEMMLNGTALEAFDGEDIGEALRDGFAVDFAIGYERASVDVDFEDWGERTVFRGSATNAGARFRLNADELYYSTSSRNSTATMSGADMPLPEVTFGTAETDIEIRMPLRAVGDSQDIRFGFRMLGLTLDDMSWSMVDPFNAFGNSPISLVLDLVGKVALNGDVYDDDMMFGIMMFGPLALGEVRELNLRELLVDAVGARLAGNAAFTFDFSDFETIPGFPKAVGVLNLALEGGNALLDKLIDMGIVGPDEAMGFRMGAAMLTRPGDGPDTMVSTIEIREDGAILANGQRIQ